MEKCLHTFILSNLKDTVIRTVKPRDNEPLTDADIMQILFQNYRHSHGKHTGLRLSDFGNRIMKSEFTCHTYTHSDKLTLETLVSLDQSMEWPYHVNFAEVTFYSDVDAAWFLMNGSQLKSYSEYI